MAATIEAAQEKIFNALQALGPSWHKRSAIAKKLGKKHLNPVDVTALEMLVVAGRIEKSSTPSVTEGRGSNLTFMTYRVAKVKA